METSLTIFTPAYNRAHTIGRTYESLCRQTSKDFCWLVVDDGSTDNTRELVQKWIADGIISIRYIYQENQGMHGAHNTAIRNTDTELVTWVDSDDWMVDDAVETIIRFWRENGSDKYAGFAGLDQDANGRIIGAKFPDEMRETTYYGYHDGGGYGDKKIVYRTEVLKSCPDYPLFEGERYLGLSYKFMLIDRQYPLLVINKPLVVVDYQDAGSSNMMWKQYWNNPKGFAFFRKTEMLATKSIKRRFMICIHYVSSSLMARNWNFIAESPCKFLTILSVPFGIALSLYIRYRVMSNAKMLRK